MYLSLYCGYALEERIRIGCDCIKAIRHCTVHTVGTNIKYVWKQTQNLNLV